VILVNDTILADVAFLASDKLLNTTQGIKQSEKQFSNLRSGTFNYQAYIKRTLRNEDVEHLLTVFNYTNNEVKIKQVLSRLATQYLSWQGNRFEVKYNKLEPWLELLSLIDGTWIIAQAYQDLANEYDVSVQDVIKSISECQCPLALPKERIEKYFADNHVHLGGHGHTGPSLLSFALYGQVINENAKWPKRAEYTLFESGKYQKSNLPVWCYQLGNKLVAYAFNQEEDFCLDIFESDTNHLNDYDGLYYLKNDIADSFAQHCILQAHSKLIPSDSRWLLFCTGILALDSSADKLVSQFVRVSNILRNYIIVSGTGLSQFVESSRFGARRTRNGQYQNSNKLDGINADIDSRTLREFRITPNVVIGDKKNVNPKELKKNLEEALKQSLTENIHFVIHFTRSGDREDKYLLESRLNIKKQVNALLQFKGSVTFSDIESKTLALSKDNGSPASLDLRKAIRGYDVAGNENELPIEIFAPALRVLRSAKHPSTSMYSSRFQKPFLTVHAGEDYSHLVSGLRSIDEAVYFCDYQAGDRIGHGLALGVLPKQWAERQQMAYITMGDHLDNLVWCYQKALEVIQKAPQFTGVLPLLQEKISFWCELLYGKSHSNRALHEAWKLRRNCPHAINIENSSTGLPYIDTTDPFYRDWIIDFAQFESHGVSKQAYELWQQYIFSSIFESNKQFQAIRKKPIVIHCIRQQLEEPFGVDDGIYYDSVSAAELDLYEAIQDLQMEKYAAQEIIIEACPTSNIYIGRFNHYHEHPIFRWNPPEQDWLKEGAKFNRFGLRKGSITVCVNTDDAALMPTTIQNEHRVLHKAAIEHYDIGINKAEDWIERIRCKGVEIFRSNHLDWVNKGK
jgi:adenosine deaminase